MRAVSLKALSKAAQDCFPANGCTEEVKNLGGIRSVLGYVLDRPNKDIVLIGKAGGSAPPLRTEDFVIALRGAWHEYGEMKGNTLEYTSLGCTIDPRAPTVLEINQAARDAMAKRTGNPEEARKAFENYRRVAAKDQDVKILGMGKQDAFSHFGKLMVDADYFMKRLVQGSVQTAIPGFTSLMDLRWTARQAAIQAGADVTQGSNSLDRFWFEPGECNFQESPDIVVIQEAPVQLLTEAEYVKDPTQIAGKGKPDPLAKEFCTNFTQHYQAIAAAFPIYKDLEERVRLVALAEALKFKNADATAGLDLNYLLKQFPVEHVEIKPHLPGISNIRESTVVTTQKSGTSQHYYQSTVSGGVAMRVDLAKKSFKAATGLDLQTAMKNVLAGRPTGSKLTWPTTGVKGIP